MVRAGGDGRGRVHIGHATGAKRPPGMNRTLPISTLWQPSQWPADAAGRKNLALLVQLRWLAIAGQLITIVAVHFVMDIRLPLAPMLLLAGMAMALNGLSLGGLRRRSDVSRSEERRVGKGCVSTGRSRGSPYN